MSFAEGAHTALCRWGLFQGRAKALYFHGFTKKKKRKVVSSSFFITGGVCDVRQGINGLVGWLEPVLLCAHTGVWDPETWL